jgi:hypothetical protein
MSDEPRVGARFVIGADGVPETLRGPKDPTRKHYRIELFTEAAPESARTITYELHPTYYDRMREVVRGGEKDEFVERITSYGDYDIRLAVSGSTHLIDVSRLTDALKRSHRDQLHEGSPVLGAIRDLEKG